MELHRLGVCERQCETGADAPCGADRAEQGGALVALVGRLDRPRAAPGPLAHEAVLLADAGLVLEPYLDPLTAGYVADMGVKRAGKVLWDGAPLITQS